MGSFPELVNISGFLVFLVVCSLSSKIKLLIISVPFALLVLLVSALMADFLKDVYDEQWHKNPCLRKFSEILTVSVVIIPKLACSSLSPRKI